MKKYILYLTLIFNLFDPYLFSEDIDNNSVENVVNEDNKVKIHQIDEHEDSLILLLTDENDDNFYTTLELSELKKCSFPCGPLRNNEIEYCDVVKIPNVIVQKIQEGVETQEYVELNLFCIDEEQNGVKSKTCGFDLPGKAELCYAFKFEIPLKETKAIVLSKEKLKELELEITKHNINEIEEFLFESLPKPNSKLKKCLQNIAINVFINSLEFADKCKITYQKMINSLKKLRHNEQPKA